MQKLSWEALLAAEKDWRIEACEFRQDFDQGLWRYKLSHLVVSVPVGTGRSIYIIHSTPFEEVICKDETHVAEFRKLISDTLRMESKITNAVMGFNKVRVV